LRRLRGPPAPSPDFHANIRFLFFTDEKRMSEKSPCVYILASAPYGTLYIGTSSDLLKRVWEHKNQFVDGFCKKHKVHNLVWFELHGDMYQAISREKNLKNWKREWKISLIEQQNPNWIDLYNTLF
jgi:putative endonuclease